MSKRLGGKIVKGIAGFYYVYCADGEIYECRARGIFRKDGCRPLVGDNVNIEVLDDRQGSLEEVLPRENELIRPLVANVDQAMVVFAMANPTPSLNLLDRFLVMMEWQSLDTVICFSKQDIVSPEEAAEFKAVYAGCSKKVITFSNISRRGIDQVRECLRGKTTVLAGPSGVGKSSLVNLLYPRASMETGSVSEKIGRGRHTTRHSELFCIGEDTFLFDTPGFSSLKLPDIDREDLRMYFAEFTDYAESCRFLGCSHIHEPDCAVKEALEQGRICRSRYENYVQMYGELSDQDRKNNGRNVR